MSFNFSIERNSAAIPTSILALVEPTYLFGHGMKGRGKGYILQLGSTVAYAPSPQMAVSSATKSFVLGFAAALANKPRDSGATVAVLCPGATTPTSANTAGLNTLSPSRARWPTLKTWPGMATKR